MYKLIKALSLSILLSISIFAQTAIDNTGSKNNLAADADKPVTFKEQTTSPREYNKNEYYIGYSNQQTGSFGRSTFHGVEGSYTRNVSRWIGIRGSVSYAQNNRSFEFNIDNGTGGATTFRQNNFRSVAQFLGGVQVKDNASTKRFKPFGFALAGLAATSNKFKNLSCSSSAVPSGCPSSFPLLTNFKFADTGLAGAFGGGLDIKINERIDFRAIQFDYNPIFSNSRVDNNFRFGVGFVFK